MLIEVSQSVGALVTFLGGKFDLHARYLPSLKIRQANLCISTYLDISRADFLLTNIPNDFSLPSASGSVDFSFLLATSSEFAK